MNNSSLSSPSHGSSFVFDRKIRLEHQQRIAVVYIRQSSMNQVHHNQESTQAQYGLVKYAENLGWPRERILVIDDDLGVSGASTEGRMGFQRLLSDVALNHVGLILGIEMSRLARSCKDWYQLLELCALFNTLICDLDGIYDPSHFNDRLLLGLKGTMSEAELHVLRQRLWQGALQKARRGALILSAPMGYLREGDSLTFDPDEQAQATIRLVFEQFSRRGTMHAVLKYLSENSIRLPFRSNSRANKNELEWRRPNQAAVKNILTHPIYAGTYVFGRTCQAKASRSRQQPYRLPRDQWMVLLRNRFPAFISWDQFEDNQTRLEQNCSRSNTRGSIRSGRALLAGLVVCQRCGYRMSTRYGGSNAKPSYRCSARTSLYGEAGCQAIKAEPLDDEVVRLALLAVQPAALTLSLQVAQDLQLQRANEDRLWKQRLERAAYEVDRAARQYQVVEPENRLVARNLELAWEEKLRAQKHLQEQCERVQRNQTKSLSIEEIEQIRQLSEDIPTLWNGIATTDADRKAILRELVDRIEVNIEGESEWVETWISWAGGNKTYTRFQRPVASTRQLSKGSLLIERLNSLLAEKLSVPRIAQQLNQEGFKTSRGNSFDESRVRMLMLRQGLHSMRRQRLTGQNHKQDEWLITELILQANIGAGTIRRMIQRCELPARKDVHGRWIVTANSQTIERLKLSASHKRRESV